MKKAILTLTAVVCAFYVNAQQLKQNHLTNALPAQKELINHTQQKTETNIDKSSFLKSKTNSNSADTMICQSVDSNGIATNSYMGIENYDSNETLIQTEAYGWDGSDWYSMNKSTYTYDANNRLIENATYDANGTQWTKSSYASYGYDNNGNTITSISYSNWDGTKWLDGFKVSYSFDSNNLVLEDYVYTWNSANSSWSSNGKGEFQYDANNYLIESIGYSWGYSSTTFTYTWIQSRKCIETNDANGNATGYTFYSWDKTANAWNFSSSVQYTFNSNNQQTSSLEYSNGTYNYSQTIYDNNGNIIESYYYQDWVNASSFGQASHSIYSYDIDGNLIESIGTIWNGSSWDSSSKTIIAYSSNMIEKFYYSWDGTQWELNYQCTNYDNPNVSTEITEAKENTGFSIYPNPMNGEATMHFSNYNNETITFMLYDSQGKQVKEIKINDGNTVLSRKNLNSGLYFYQVKSKENVFSSGKLLIN